jgi:hypothetical protein
VSTYEKQAKQWRLTLRQTTPSRSATINDSFPVADGMERAQLIFESSFNIAISNERVSLFAVLGEVPEATQKNNGAFKVLETRTCIALVFKIKFKESSVTLIKILPSSLYETPFSSSQ